MFLLLEKKTCCRYALKVNKKGDKNMRIFNVAVHPENGTNESLIKSDFKFTREGIKYNNKYLSNDILGQRLRIDKYIDTDSEDVLKSEAEDKLTLYSYKTYNVLENVTTDVVLNNRSLNPLLLKTKTANNYELMYITFDSAYKLLEYSTETQNKIISTYHKKDFYGCALYFDKEKHRSSGKPIISIKAIDTSKNDTVVNLHFYIDSENDSAITMEYFIEKKVANVDNKKNPNKPIRFKLKLNPHKIPTELVIVDEYCRDGDPDAHDICNDIDKIRENPNSTMYVEMGEYKIDDPEFIEFLKNTINEGHYKSVTLVDIYMPHDIIKALKLVYVFAYDSSKKIVKCIRSA